MPATVHNGESMTRSKGRRIPHMDYFCMPGGYFGQQTSENAQNANFAKTEFYEVRHLQANAQTTRKIVHLGNAPST